MGWVGGGGRERGREGERREGERERGRETPRGREGEGERERRPVSPVPQRKVRRRSACRAFIKFHGLEREGGREGGGGREIERGERGERGRAGKIDCKKERCVLLSSTILIVRHSLSSPLCASFCRSLLLFVRHSLSYPSVLTGRSRIGGRIRASLQQDPHRRSTRASL
jgi:hypothetical protein